ncbi:MAG: DUF4252 domain-containing protein [Bacteroides sp.]|nr:DUF4252 domain-containing protein [Bacteroides sp.]
MTELKHILTATIIFLCGMSVSAQNNDFEKIARIPNVEYVYVSKSMLKSLESLDSASEFNFIRSAKELNSVEIISCDDADNIAEVNDKLSEATNDLELLSKVKSENKNINIYGKRHGDGLSEILVISPMHEKVVAVFIKGNMDAETLKAIAEIKQ